jgi:hypothetical protein
VPDLHAIVQRMIDAGESEDNIATVIQHTNATPEQPKAAPTTFGPRGGPIGQMLLHGIVKHPVEAGALAGGLAAAPFTGGASIPAAMAATGLAGAAGAGLGIVGNRVRQAVQTGDYHTPIDTTDAAKQMATQGASQAAMEGGGRMLTGVLRKGASRLYQSVLKPTLAARMENPNLVQTALENRIPVSAGGADKAGQLVGQSMDKADALVAAQAAGPNAPTIDPRRAVAGITRAVKDVKDLPVARPQMQAIGDYARQYMGEHPAPLSLTDAQRAVRATDKFYNPAYRATMDRGNAVTSGQTAAALGINNETRGLLRQAVPGLREQNAVTSGLAGVREAVERRSGQQANNSAVPMRHLINIGLGSGVGAVGGRDKGVGTFAAMEAITNPAVASRLAIGMHGASGVPFSQALRALLMARLAGDDSPTQK